MNAIVDGGHPIIVVVDQSEHACEATEWAAELAAAVGAPLHLISMPQVAADGPLPTWLGMLRVAAWRAGTEPDMIKSVTGRFPDVLAGEAAGARLLVLGIDLSAHVSQESAAVSFLAEQLRCPVAVIRGHAAGLCPPLRGPIVVASDGTIPAFAAEIATALGAGIDTVDIEHSAAERSLSILFEQARHARLVVLEPPVRRCSWVADASRRLIEQARCPVIMTEPTGIDVTAAERHAGNGSYQPTARFDRREDVATAR